MDETILIVDDEPRVIQLVQTNLEMEGFRVVNAASGYQALEKVSKDLPDLVVLDIMMPEMDGFETLQRIRQISQVPVIFLSVRGQELDQVKGLDLGADDYVTKPFSIKELVSRMKAVLRRTRAKPSGEGQEVVVDDELRIDFNQRVVVARGQEVRLRPTEYRLLYQLVTNAGRLLTHGTLLSRVWGPEYRDEDQYVRLYINYLRRKIEKDPKNPKYILSERGLGYRFKGFGRRA
ncbi:MAG: response regulator transcription factor [Chloroflexi bacterium]|nr:response regulator transcription factor [Chloroflexota bacterium]